MPLYSPRYAQVFSRLGKSLARAVVRMMGVERKSNSSEWKRDLRVGAFVSVVALCFVVFGLVDILSYDLLFAFWPNRAVRDEVAIIYMDDESHRELKQPYPPSIWNRELHAQLIERLTQYRVKAIVFDVLFDQTTTTSADKHLVEATKKSGKVVVAGVVHFVNNIWETIEPFPELKDAVRWGAIESPNTRLHYYARVDVPSLASRAAELAEGQKPFEPRERWLNYYGPPGRISSCSYYAVLNNLIPASFFSNKVVFIGEKGTIGFTDDHRTPYTLRTGLKSPGVDINVTAYLNLVHREWNTRLWWPVEVLLVAVFGVLLAIVLRRLTPVRASIASAAIAAVIFAVTLVVMHKYHYWFPWLAVSAVEVPVALACVLILKVQRATTEMQRPDARAGAPGVSTPAAAHAPNGTRVVDEARAGDGLVIPDYTLVRNIGSGSYGEVWLAQSIIGSFHGVKIIYRHKFQEDRPFDREFEGIKHFEPISRKHHGLVHILHVGRNRERGYFFYVMELAEDANAGGQIVPESYEPRTLSVEIKKRGAISARECVRLAIELSEALGFLHGEGLIHRDIKPGNIIYSGGKPKFADIGLVTQVGNDRTWVGTQGFFPPEGTGTLLADIYSLGKTLYCAYTGLPVDRFPDLPTKIPEAGDVPAFQTLNRIILKACENDPRLRYQTAAELQQDLLELAAKG